MTFPGASDADTETLKAMFDMATFRTESKDANSPKMDFGNLIRSNSLYNRFEENNYARLESPKVDFVRIVDTIDFAAESKDENDTEVDAFAQGLTQMIEEEVSKLGLASMVDLQQSPTVSPVTELLQIIQSMLRTIKIMQLKNC